MKTLPISEGDKVLHIHSYQKKMDETKVTSNSRWGAELDNKNKVDQFDTLIRLDDPVLIDAKIDYQRYLCVQTFAHINRNKLSDEVLSKMDELYSLLSKEEKEKTQSMLLSCGALTKEPSFLATKIKK